MSEQNKVLLVEDDEFLSHAYRDGLTRAGFIVELAMDGATAVKKMKEENPDLVLLDLVMPVKNGFEVLEEARLDKKLRKIPIIILTNLGQDSDIKKGKELGAIDYLVKTDLSMKAVVEKVKYHLAKI